MLRLPNVILTPQTCPSARFKHMHTTKTIFLRFRRASLPIIAFGLGLLSICYLSFASFSSIEEFVRRTSWVDHSHLVRFELEKTISLAKDAQAATRGYAIVGKPEFLLPYQIASTALPEIIARLQVMTADNPTQARDTLLLKDAAAQVVATFGHTINLRRTSTVASNALEYIAAGTGENVLNQMRVLVARMEERESQLLARRKQEERVSAGNTQRLIVGGTLASCLLFAGGFWLLSREVRQRRRADGALLAANGELLQYAGRLEAANKELESFTYSISHDLRIPLRAIAGYAGMLTEDYGNTLDAEGQRLLGVIRDNSKRMGALIDDLLAFSKFGRKVLSTTSIEMRTLVENVVAELRGHGQSHTPTQAARIILGEIPAAWGDRAMLQQVWINLLSNALKYSSKAPAPQVHISGRREGDEIIYAVTDNGVGFDMQYYDKLFGVFQRLHSADMFPGTGVGLAIVKRIVQRHGGRVWAEGGIDQGATFYFALQHKDAS